MPTIKINTDDASKGNSGLAGAKCVLRNHHIKYVTGAAYNLKITTSVLAEL